MESDKSASVFALAVMVGIVLYALTEKPWMFFLGFLACFLPVFIGKPSHKPKRQLRPTNAPSFLQSIIESFAHGDR